MLSRHRVSRQAIELIKQFEGYRRKSAQLPDGRWTIGYGHTLTAREGAEVSETDAEALLVYDLIAVQHAVNENLLAPLGQNGFDALCSFAFNIGLDNFRRSQVLKRLNAGAMVQAGCAMELWRKADFEGERIVIDALVRRRAAEKALFLTPDDGVFVAAPSPLLRPVVDLDAQDLVPQRRPVTVETSMEGPRVVARRDDLPDEAAEAVAPEPAEARQAAVAAAAEAVAGRLSSLFADAGDDLLDTTVPTPEPEAEAATPPPEAAPARPQAVFAEPISLAPPRELEPEPEPEPRPAFRGESGPDAELDIPQAPMMRRIDFDDRPAPPPEPEIGPSEFIPARPTPAPRPPERSVIWSLMLALFGLAFFGFGVFWGLNARGEALGGLITPMVVAWLAGVAGVLFFSVAVFYLLQNIGQAAERD